MRITYRTLASLIERMSEEQKDCDVTVEDSSESECYPAELRIAGEEHDSLDEDHPVIFIQFDDSSRESDVDEISKQIGL